jgi:hypothetical protein
MLVPSAEPHEHVLCHLWNTRYLSSARLVTTDGQPVDIVDAGNLNLHSGPDYLNARIRIDGVLFAGDVEFHRTAAEWSTHGHDRDPRYNRVILHVILDGHKTPSAAIAHCGRQVPTLVLSEFLNASPDVIRHLAELDERRRVAQTIPCAELNYDVPSELLYDWLSRLAVERLELKLRRIDERLLELIRSTSGEPVAAHAFASKEHWEQALYEGLMDALGYVRNRVPFVQLAQRVTLAVVELLGIADTPLLVEALLFGAAGLIPDPDSLRSAHSQRYAAQIEEAWGALRHRYHGEVLHVADWSFAPTRPGNFPTGRIAAGAGLIHALLRKDLFRNVVQVLQMELLPSIHQRELMRLLSAQPSLYWQNHYHFDRHNTCETLRLGEARKREMIVNVLVPLVLCYAWRFHDAPLRSRALTLFNSILSSGGNFISRLLEGHLLRGKVSLARAEMEQGVIQLYHFYCTRGRCGECAVGKELGLRN